MRVFMCSYSGFSLAIPMSAVSSIFIYNEKADFKYHYNSENRNTYISLPVLFNCPFSRAYHGIILKFGETDNEVAEDKIILLSTEIEKEKEIPSNRLYSIPKVFCYMQFSSIFKGIFFNSNSSADDLTLLLNPEQLVQNIQKEIIK